ncbi:MAG: hypothetical protein N4A40_00535 [Tissierellales bacterium]|nr:hypothetical protein [Tissierellales bacterium]
MNDTKKKGEDLMTSIKVLSKQDIKDVLDIREVIEKAERVYVAKVKNMTEVWPTVFYDFELGKADMDIKSGYLKEENLFGHKTVTWFGDNESKGIPTLMGLLTIFDSTTGEPIGVMDASYITGIRTGAAGAIGAKYLADKTSEKLLIVGAGNQCKFQIAAMLTVMPQVKTVKIASRKYLKAVSVAEKMKEVMKSEFDIDTSNVDFLAVENLEEAVRESKIIVTITPSRKPIINYEWVQKGTHISCIGADMSGKQEIDAKILASSTIFCDDYVHCKEVGEIESAIKENIISEDDVSGEIGQVICGLKKGREHCDDITIFDATGMALLDIVTGNVALKLSDEKNIGTLVEI